MRAKQEREGGREVNEASGGCEKCCPVSADTPRVCCLIDIIVTVSRCLSRLVCLPQAVTSRGQDRGGLVSSTVYAPSGMEGLLLVMMGAGNSVLMG